MIVMIFAIFLGIFFTLIFIDNTQIINIDFFGNSIDLPLFVVMLSAFLIGILLANLISLFDWTVSAVDQKRKESNYTNAIKVSELLRQEVNKLKSENQQLQEDLTSIKNDYYERKTMEMKSYIKIFFQKLLHNRKPSQKTYV